MSWLRRAWATPAALLFIAILIISIVLGVSGCIPFNVAELLVLGLTGIAVVVYTYVNWCLVQETQALRITQLRPYVLPLYDFHQHRFSLANVGNGSAINVKLEKIRPVKSSVGPEWDWHLVPVPDEFPLLKPNEPPIMLSFESYLGTVKQQGHEHTLGGALSPAGSATVDFLIEGSYQDIDHRDYTFRVQTGKNGFRILSE